jgi:glutamate dehydrogenase
MEGPMALMAKPEPIELPAGDALIEVAGRQLVARRADIPASFVTTLFGRALPDDLARYRPEDIVRLTEAAWSWLAERQPGAPNIRLAAPSTAASDPLADVSVLEIVNDDMPFLVDSVMGELTDFGLEIRLVVHPVFNVLRDSSGRLTALPDALPAGTALRESFIHIHVERIDDEARRNELLALLAQVLAEVRVCVQDWRLMTTRVRAEVAALSNVPPPLPVGETAEAVQFLEWLLADNFTFLGVREYLFTVGGDELAPRGETGLGLLRAPEARVLHQPSQVVEITAEIRAFLMEPTLLIVTKSAVRSRVHRRIHMDYIGVKHFGPDGRLLGELRIVGLFTSTAYTQSTRSIPYLRRKVDAVIRRAGFESDSHSGKALINVLETYPRDELFQIDDDTLYEFALAILQLEERPRLRVLPRRDRFDRFVSVFAYVPRDRYDSHVRKAIGDYLAQSYRGQVRAFYPFFPEGPLVRVHFIIGWLEGVSARPDRTTLERTISGMVRNWTDGLSEALLAAYPASKARALMARYRGAFSDGYREAYLPQIAVEDIRLIEGLSAERQLSVDFHNRAADRRTALGLKVWSRGRPIPLSERVPVLENMGFRVVDELTYKVVVGGAQAAEVWFHDMAIEPADGGGVELADAKLRLESCFLAVMGGGAENDGYNALVLTAGLMWRDVALIRTLSRFLRQTQVPYSQDYMWATLVKHPGAAAAILHLFQVRFDPRPGPTANARAEREAAATAAIEAALQLVDSLDEDRIMRHFVNAVQAALRTNFYQVDSTGRSKALIAIKFASRQLEGLPAPRPLYEIFVYSPRVEGVHLRFGKVARGGIRWSDRPQDFRTEVLGLVKAQQVKNAVIVPVGAKGGFVPKGLPKGASREDIQTEGVAGYRLFIASLLDLTDNIGEHGIVAPADMERYDEDDPYLVVAADKGTASFSDIANSIADRRGFWLGDAFASGGSAGYDHKKMGITARGAWESVKRHFRELDIDIARTPFTVAGVGDMSGDVFGNGMLRESTIQLVAAFDHRDIFIDPQPVPARSYAERRRLFGLPRSSWQDYDRAQISAGGGVYSRSAKEIKLSPPARALLDLPERVTPAEIIAAILTLSVDLLWFGGIGTYVRASDETDEAVGDRTNDAVRVSGAALRCKVIGEGANLGMTQRGRIEAALGGIRLNTDAIDNSAGVNTSDLEVNIKIALTPAVRDGRLTVASRNALLVEMTESVAALVLRNNYQQTLSLSLAERRGVEYLGFQQRMMQSLEQRGLLDRGVEFLPDDLELSERRRHTQPLTRPELAVLLAYAKLALNDELLRSNVPDDPYLGRELARYFPPAIAERFPDVLAQHRLRREIISTQLANSIINRGGPTFEIRIEDQTGASAAEIAAAFAAVRDSYGMTALNAEIDALDTKIPGKLQLELYAVVQDLLGDRVVWFLRNVDLSNGLATIVEHYRDGIAEVEKALERVLSTDAAAGCAVRLATMVQAGVPAALAGRIASLPVLMSAPDIVLVAERTGQKIADAAATYFAAEAYFQLDRIISAARDIKVTEYFDRLALDRALDAIGDAQRRLAVAVAVVAKGSAGQSAVEAWVVVRRQEVERIRTAVLEIANSGLTLSKLSVAASLLGDLVRR